MSRILSKKVNRTPVRSPSPDVACKNIIVRTASPLSEAITKLRMSKSSKSPLGRGFSSTQEYENHINNLQERIRLLTKENQALHHENDSKVKQVDFLREMNAKYRKQIHTKSGPYLQYQPPLLDQYESKIKDLSKELVRMQDILTSYKSDIDKLERENSDLKSRVSPIRNSRIQAYEERNTGKDISKELEDIKYSLNSSFNRRLADYQSKVEMVFEEQIKKLNKIEGDHKAILRLIEDNKSYISPVKNGKGREQFTSTFSPEEIIQKSKQSRFTRQAQCQSCKIYLKRIGQLEAEINVKTFTSNHASKSTINKQTIPKSYLEDYLQKLQEIKMILNNQQVDESISHIENHLNDIYNIEEKFEYMNEQKNSIIQELRQKEIQQSIEIVKLNKENQLFKVKIKEQLDEIEKLKELIETSIQETRKQESPQKKKNIPNEGNILRSRIEQAIGKLEILQSQIGDTLRS